MTAFRRLPGLALVVAVLVPAPGAAQERVELDRRGEARLLREATAREAAGDLTGAEEVLEELMSRSPTSAAGLFALERVLRAQGRATEVLEAVEAWLEVEPAAAPPHHLRLRILTEADSLEALEEAGEAWIEAVPGEPDAYREVSRAWADAFGPERALHVIARGRMALSNPSAMALEAGELRLASGDLQGAVEEWARAVGDDGDQGGPVLRTLDRIAGGPGPVARPLVRRLVQEPTTPERRRVAARIAVETGLADDALEIVDDLLPELSPASRRALLLDVARRADGRDMDGLALRAWSRLLEATDDDEERRMLDARIAEAALAVGDTAMALEHRTRMARAYPAGSPERRRALAATLGLDWATGDPARAEERLREFRDEFPGAPELDGLASALARRLLARGDEARAARVVESVEGPLSALERGYLALGRGEPGAAREELFRAVEGVEPHRATGLVQLLTLLEALGPEARTPAGTAAALAHHGRTGEALDGLEDALPDVEEVDRAPLLALGARLADRGGRPDRAAGLREALIRDHPGADELPEALLDQARYHASVGGGPEPAAELLERLIVERPESPVVPAARRELARLRAGGDRGGSGQ